MRVFLAEMVEGAVETALEHRPHTLDPIGVRHTAATRLAPRLSVLDLCRMFGWAKADQALTYYNPSAGEIAKRLAA